ncbi:MAG: serine hydrolase domain-containing protein [Bacteroidota bacterium]
MKIFQKISTSFLIILACSCSKAEFVAPETYNCTLSNPESTNAHPKSAAFRTELEKIAQKTPGVMVALRTPDGATWLQSSGMADIANDIALENCHKMMIGSISKVFTAVMIFRLQDQGLLTIEDPLTKWIDASITNQLENANEVSLKQMLNHTSGLADYNNTQFNLDATNRPFMKLSQEEKLEYAYGEKATHAPGSTYAYSNTNFVLLGMVAEAATGKIQAKILQENIFTPLGMTSAAYGSVEEPLPTGVVRPYVSVREGRYFDSKHLDIADANTGDGGVAANMQDLRTFVEGLFQGKLLSDASFTQMTQTLYEKPEDEHDYEGHNGESSGLGIDLYKMLEGDAYGHTGGIFGFNAYMLYFPETQASLCIAYNGAEERTSSDYKREFREAMLNIMFE